MAFGQNHSRYDPLLWQATLESFVRHLKHLHSIDETNLVQRSPRQLTTEAIYTIYVMVTFVTLSLLGTLLTLYEHLCKAKENNNNSRKNGIVTCKTTQKKPPAHHFTKVWLAHCRGFLNCFCVLNNGRSLLSLASKEDGFDCLHGIRVLSNIWITFGHVSIFYVLSLSKKADFYNSLTRFRS
ncbi:UNVERIFIED_CONTAM: hypothetical protein NCL1_27604 [Trichonephila clavipes]